MVAIQIGYIHGNYLIETQAEKPYDLAAVVSPSVVLAAAPEASELKLTRRMDQVVWRAQMPDGPAFFDAAKGEKLVDPTEAEIRTYAKALFTGDGDIVSAKLLTKAPSELKSRKPPYWAVEFDGWQRPILYLSPQTGELIAKRHAAWRVFDIAWMLHIMDYDERTNPNNLLLRVASWLSFAMAVSGAWLLFWAFPRKKKKKVQKKVIGA